MLAAAGGASVHPHAASPDSERTRWDRDLANATADVRRLERFFEDILDGRLATDDTITTVGMSFFGVQGPWYTVGWLMASTIERELGRGVLVASSCDPAQFLRDYDSAARQARAAGDAMPPRWSEELLERLRP